MAHLERVVLLVDMDCFYCQVEEQLDFNLVGKPIAVVQYNAWKGGGIIAVNYRAREKGVTRHMRGDEAKEKCPEIELVRVPNVRGKADLSKYRDAGKRVAKVLETFTPLLSRASVDEAYLDITEAVKARKFQYELGDTHVVGYKTEEFLKNIKEGFGYDSNLKLAIGAVIAQEIRAEVLKVTGYTCSAGIAHNKILAKLAAGMHKPNQQTLLPQESVPQLFETLPLKKVKNLGGKFGYTLGEELGIQYMGELTNFSEKELIKRFGEKNGKWVHEIARGIDNECVTPKLISKSIGCCKKFPGRNALTDVQSVTHWLQELAEEISERLDQDMEENNRRAKQMIVSFAQEVNKNDVSSSRTVPLNSYDATRIVQDAFEVLKKFCMKSDGSFSIKFLGISAGKFEDCKNQNRIKKFFQSTGSKDVFLVKQDNSEVAEGNEKDLFENNCAKNTLYFNENKSENSNLLLNEPKITTTTNLIVNKINSKGNKLTAKKSSLKVKDISLFFKPQGNEKILNLSSEDMFANTQVNEDSVKTTTEENRSCLENSFTFPLGQLIVNENKGNINLEFDDSSNYSTSTDDLNCDYSHYQVYKESFVENNENITSLIGGNFLKSSNVESVKKNKFSVDNGYFTVTNSINFNEKNNTNNENLDKSFSVNTNGNFCDKNNENFAIEKQLKESIESDDSLSNEILGDDQDKKFNSSQHGSHFQFFFENLQSNSSNRDFNTSKHLEVEKDLSNENLPLIDQELQNSPQQEVEQEFDDETAFMAKFDHYKFVEKAQLPECPNPKKVYCPECFQRVLKTEMISHMDYHVALKIVREEASLYKDLSNVKNQVSPVKKSFEKNTKTSPKKKSLKRKPENCVKLTTFLEKFEGKERASCSSEICPKCKAKVPLSELSSHADYHLAKKLHLELNTVVKPTERVEKWCGKKKNVKSKGSGKTGTISAFFKQV